MLEAFLVLRKLQTLLGLSGTFDEALISIT